MFPYSHVFPCTSGPISFPFQDQIHYIQIVHSYLSLRSAPGSPHVTVMGREGPWTPGRYRLLLFPVSPAAWIYHLAFFLEKLQLCGGLSVCPQGWPCCAPQSLHRDVCVMGEPGSLQPAGWTADCKAGLRAWGAEERCRWAAGRCVQDEGFYVKGWCFVKRVCFAIILSYCPTVLWYYLSWPPSCSVCLLILCQNQVTPHWAVNTV